jgi:hypothetical protein
MAGMACCASRAGNPDALRLARTEKALLDDVVFRRSAENCDPAVGSRRQTHPKSILNPELVGGRGHYLKSQNELPGGPLDLIRTHRDQLD